MTATNEQDKRKDTRVVLLDLNMADMGQTLQPRAAPPPWKMKNKPSPPFTNNADALEGRRLVSTARPASRTLP
jgi:hypothetical protein